MAKQKFFTEEMGRNIFVFPTPISSTPKIINAQRSFSKNAVKSKKYKANPIKHINY